MEPEVTASDIFREARRVGWAAERAGRAMFIDALRTTLEASGVLTQATFEQIVNMVNSEPRIFDQYWPPDPDHESVEDALDILQRERPDKMLKGIFNSIVSFGETFSVEEVPDGN